MSTLVEQARSMKEQMDRVYLAVQEIASVLSPIESKMAELKILAEQSGLPVSLNMHWSIEELDRTGGDLFNNDNWNNSNCW